MLLRPLEGAFHIVGKTLDDRMTRGAMTKRPKALEWRRAARMCALLAALLPTGCVEDVTLAGIWTLRTIGGSNLPVVISDDGNRVESVSSGLLYADRASCRLDATYLVAVGGVGQAPREESLTCLWEQSGVEVALTWVGNGGAASGSIEEPFVRLVHFGGLDWVYERVQ
jgi:hypothetical protein